MTQHVLDILRPRGWGGGGRSAQYSWREWFAQKWAHHIDLAIIFYLRPTLGVSVTLFPRSEATLAPSVRVHPKGENEAFLANLAIPCPNGNVYHRKWFLKYQNIQLGIYEMIRIFAADLPTPRVK